MSRRHGGLLLLLLILALPAGAQEGPSLPTADGPVDAPAPGVNEPRPGLIKLGPFYVTPFLRLRSAGLDTNVFYSATDRRIDGTAQGGPGLDIVLPAGDVRVLVGGNLDYLYFVRTKSQRRLGGNGRARLEWSPGRLRAGVEELYVRSFDRPSLEVDERVLQEDWATHGDLSLSLPGRLGFNTTVNSIRRQVPEAADFRGTDLRRTLSHDEHRLTAGPRYRLTQKTSALIEGDLQLDRFARDPSRDADSNRVYAGFEIASPTRLSGRAVGGVRFFRARPGGPLPKQTSPYVATDLSYRFRPRTLLRMQYDRDLSFSAFDTTSGSPTLRNDRVEARLEKGLFGRFVIDIFGGYVRLLSSGAVTLLTDSGETETRVRDDKSWSGGVDFGYQFRSRVRIGVAATYLDRRSTFSDLGIHGVLVGGTVRYTPNN